MRKLSINIISDGEITTIFLLRQVFENMKDVSNVNILYLQDVSTDDLSNRINVFCRNCNPGFNWLPKFLKRKNIPYIYYIDDNLWELNDGTILADYHSSPEVLNSLSEFVKYASVVIASTKKLEEYITDKSMNASNKVISLPNFIDFSKFSFSNDQQPNQKKNFRIGYAGSAKQKAFDPVLSALQEIRDLGWDFSVEFVGFEPKTKLKIDQKYSYQSSYEKYVSLVKERNWDLALAPFLDDYFWSFKTDNKYREYSALKIPAIYSDVEPYSRVISEGINGFLSKNDITSWKNKILSILKGDFDLESIAERASNDVRLKYDITKISQIWSEQVNFKQFFLSEIKLNPYDRIYWYIKKNISILYLIFLFKIFFYSLRKDGIFCTFKKAVRFLKKRIK